MTIKPFVNFTFYFLFFLASSVSGVSPYDDNFSEDDWAEPVTKMINTGDYKSAINELTNIDKPELASWNNLMGYSLRKLSPPDLLSSEKYYQRALSIDPNYKSALEYYGELKLMQNDLLGAKELLGRLKKLCPLGCEELDILSKAIKRFETQ